MTGKHGKKVRWGILATGGIAGKFAQALTDLESAALVAVGSRTRASAEAFAATWNIPRAHGSYAALANDPDVDVVYIATPHSLHYDNMLLCLEAGKHVLCEKPLTLNVQQASVCMALARKKNLFLMEAFWTRFVPAIRHLKAMVDNGAIGELKLVKADFCINAPFSADNRLFAPSLGGGAMLDLGIYPLSLAMLLAGHPLRHTSSAQMNTVTGVDERVSIELFHANGVQAQLSTGSRAALPIEALITGSKGTIRVHQPFICPDRLTLCLEGKAAQEIVIPYRSNGYLHEAAEVHACLAAGLLESSLMPHSETLAQLEVMDAMRKSWNLCYPQELVAGTDAPHRVD